MEIIDIHTHGIAGFDTRHATCETILKILDIHAREGVSAIVPTVYPASIEQTRRDLTAIKDAMKKDERILGAHLEGPFLNPLRAGSLDASSFLPPTNKNLMDILEGFEDVVRIITLAPELDGALDIIKRLSAIGIIVSMGHSDATYAEGEAGYNAGARGITHLFNAMRPLHHREPGIAGFALTNKDIYIEVIADPYHLHPKTIELILSIKPHDRIILISDSVKGTMTSDSSIKNENGTLLGGAMTVAQSAKRLVSLGYAEDAVMKFISENPKRYVTL